MSRLSVGVEQIGMSPRIPPEDTFILAHYLTDVLHHELWSMGKCVYAQGYVANSTRIVNLCAGFSARITCPHETVAFYLPRAAINEIAEEEEAPRIGHLACVLGQVDPMITHLSAALLPAFDDPAASGTLFADHAILALCSHVLRRYGDSGQGLIHRRGGLTRRQAARAKEFMAAHCAEDISLNDVARECGLSRGHFARAFRVSTGMTPHQWRQRRRIDMAKEMLSQTAMPIVEVALSCGFVDQSHLTRVFVRLVGQSPALWRRGSRLGHSRREVSENV